MQKSNLICKQFDVSVKTELAEIHREDSLVLASSDPARLKFSSIISPNVLDALTLKLNSGVEIWTYYFVSEQISDGSLNVRMTSANLDHIIDKMSLRLDILDDLVIGLPFRHILKDKHLLE